MKIPTDIKSYVRQTTLSNLMAFDEINYTKTNINKFYKVLGYIACSTVNLVAVADIIPGESITRNKIKPGKIPVIAGGRESPYSVNKFNRSGDVITVSQSGSAGYVWYHKNPIFASDCFTIKANERTRYSTRELYYLLKLREREIISMGMGSVQHHVYAEDLYKFQVPILNSKQHNKFRQMIFNRAKILKKYHKEIISLRYELNSISKNAYDSTDNKIRVDHLEQDGILESKGGKRIPKQDDYCPFSTIHYYPRVKEFEYNSINLQDSGYIDSNTFKKIHRYILLKNDVYLSIAGTIGVSGIINDIPTYVDKDGEIHHKTISLTENAMKFTHVNSNKLVPLFLDIQIKSKEFQSILRRAELDNDTPKLSLNNIRTCKIAVPSIGIQQKYCRKWQYIFSTINKVKRVKNSFKQKNLLNGILVN